MRARKITLGFVILFTSILGTAADAPVSDGQPMTNTGYAGVVPAASRANVNDVTNPGSAVTTFNAQSAAVDSVAPQFQRDRIKASNTREVWINPNAWIAFKPKGWLTLFDTPEQWPTVLGQIDVYQFFQGAMVNYTPTQMRNAVTLFKAHGIAVSVEISGVTIASCNGLEDQSESSRAITAAQRSAALTVAALRTYTNQGGTVRYGAMDTSGVADVTGSGTACKLSMASGMLALTTYAHAVQDQFPGIELGIIPNFPNYNYGGIACIHGASTSVNCVKPFDGVDYRDVLAEMTRSLRAANVNLTFVHADMPVDYFAATPTVANPLTQRLIALKNQVQALGLRFGWLANTQDGFGAPAVDAASDQRFQQATLWGLQQYVAAGGLTGASEVVFETWFPFPAAILPEGEAYTFMQGASAVARVVRGAMHPVLGSLDEVTLNGTSLNVRGWACAKSTSEMISVHVYDGKAGSGRILGGGQTGITSEPAIEAVCSGGGAYRFNFDVPNVTALASQVYVYGISPYGAASVQLGARTAAAGTPGGSISMASISSVSNTASTVVKSSTPQSPSVVIHRFVTNQSVVHDYTTGVTPGAGYRHEGPAFKIMAVDADTGTANLYRCPYGTARFLTTDGNCEGEGLPLNTIGSVAVQPRDHTAPLFRFYYAPTGDHFYTLDRAEGDRYHMAFERIEGYVGAP